MSKINQQGTYKGETLQEKSINNLFSGLDDDILIIYKNQLTQCMLDPKHAKHHIALELLRDSRKKTENIKNQIFISNTINALNRMKEIGINKETIKDIIESVYDLRLNYYNIKKKIDTLDITISPSKNIWKSNLPNKIKESIGGECGGLSKYLIKILREKYVFEKIRESINKNPLHYLALGKSRTHFASQGSQHLFVILNIDREKFILDPALGVISLLKDSKYIIEKQAILSKSFSHDMGHIENSIGKINTKGKDIHVYAEYIPLGFLDNTNYYIAFSYVYNNKGKIHPILKSKDKESNSNEYFLDDKGGLEQIKSIETPLYLQNKIKQILYKLYNITGLETPKKTTLSSSLLSQYD